MNASWILLSLWLSIGHASEREVLFRASSPFKEAKCTLASGKTLILLLRLKEFKSPRDPEPAGAPLVYLRSPVIHNVRMLSEPEPALYKFYPPEKGSICDQTLGIELGEGMVALFFNEIRSADITHVVLFDSKADVIKEKKILGVIQSVKPVKNGFSWAEGGVTRTLTVTAKGIQEESAPPQGKNPR